MMIPYPQLPPGWLLDSSDPSRSPVPGLADDLESTSETTSKKRRNRRDKISGPDENSSSNSDGSSDEKVLETPRKRKKLVQKQLTFSSGQTSNVNQMSKNERKRKRNAENRVRNNPGLSPEELAMLKSLTKRHKSINKSPFVKISKSQSILEKDGKSVAISARKAGRQRLRDPTRWVVNDADTADDYVRQNPGVLDRSRLRVPTNKLEKIELLGRLRKAEIESYAFKGIGVDTYPVIDSYNPDLKAFCQNMKNKLNAVDCAKFLDNKTLPTWDMIDVGQYRNEEELLILVNSINIQNEELFKRKDKFVFAVLKQACLKNYDFTLRVQDMDYNEGAVINIWNIINEYIHDDEVLYLKEVSDKWIRMQFKPYETLRNFFSRIDALCQEFLTKCHIKKEDPEILALVMKELPKDLKYHLQLLEGPNNEVRSWHWIKTKLVRFSENFNQDMPQIRKFNYRYPLKTQVTNMAEAVNCICHFCGQQGHKRNDCPIRRAIWRRKG